MFLSRFRSHDPSVLLAAGAIACALEVSLLPVSATAAPVFGFVKVTLRGSDAGAGNNFVGPALVEGEAYRGTLIPGVPAPQALTVSAANWAAGAFNATATARSHYVEIVDSANPAAVGIVTDIVSHTANTLTTADELSGVLRGGETIVIRRHKTLASVFGSADEAGLGQGDPLTADTISTLAAGPDAAFSSYYFRSGQALGGTGWRSSSNPLADQSQIPVRIGDGLLIKRKRKDPLKLTLHGFVKPGPLRQVLRNGYNLIDPLAAVTDQSGGVPGGGPKFTLGEPLSGNFLPSGLSAVLTPGSTQSADLLSIFNPTSGFASYYLASSGPLGAGGWRATSNPVADMRGTVIPPATALLIQNRGPSKSWTRPQPFILRTP